MRIYIKKIIIITILVFSLPLYSKSPKTYNKRGVEFGKLKRYDQAVKEFDKSIDIYNNASARAIHNKAWVLELKGDIPAAISFYEEAVRRNTKQIPSMERVGYLYYTTGEYAKAVKTGERVLKLDPENQEVIKWLPDAYVMNLKKNRETALAKKKDAPKDGKPCPCKEEKEEKKKEDKGPPTLLYATLDAMIRTSYYFRGDDEGYGYESTPGAYGNFPEMIYIRFKPTKIWEFDVEFGNPYLGALSPNLVIHTESFQAIANLGDYSMGLGFMGNHYKGSSAFPAFPSETKTLHDYKIGFIFGAKKEKVDMRFVLYPRLLLRDNSSSSGKTLDVDYAKFSYNYKIDKFLTFFSWLSVRDYFFFDHEESTSNYWGVYELGFGVTLIKYDKVTDRKFLSITFDFTERFYMRDLNNDKPYGFANGQGLFGANSGEWLEGDPFSGYRAPGHVLSIKVEEWVHQNIFLYQKIIIEMVDRSEDHNEFSLLLGVGGIYF